jgi:hypothetical protein
MMKLSVSRELHGQSTTLWRDEGLAYGFSFNID